MKLPYSKIFQDSAGPIDGESACGLNMAATRFFLSLADFPHAFYEDGQWIELSDNERQLLEDGIASFSRIHAIGLCNMTKVIYRGNHPQASMPQTIENYYTLNQPVQMDNDAVALVGSSTLEILESGEYSMTARFRVHGTETGQGDFLHAIRILRNTNVVAIDESRRSFTQWSTLECNITMPLFAGDLIQVSYQHGRTSNVTNHSALTSLFMVRL